MGKYRKYRKNLDRLLGELDTVAVDILRNWKPVKKHGLSKKEARAAYVGFALGVINAITSVKDGTVICDRGVNDTVYDWLCEMVADYRDDIDDFMECVDDHCGSNEDSCSGMFEVRSLPADVYRMLLGLDDGDEAELGDILEMFSDDE